ncbi:MAG: SH3 domain-containing protein [Anaerolineae bacterium]|nr:SH3 domain-containing protein [Anaerolineae bacterium]
MIRFHHWLLFVILTVLIPIYGTQAQCTPRADWTNTYTVVRGDTLFRIAQRYSVSVTDLAQENCITNTSLIYAGQMLLVPSTTTGQSLTVRLPNATSVYDSPNSSVVLVPLQAGNVTAIGRSQDTNWVFIRVANVQGWVWSYTLEMDSTLINSLPIVTQRGSIDSGTANSCTQTLPSRVSVGSQARVLPGVPNNVRSTYSTTGALVGTLPGETVFSVTGGPQCAEGILWWQIYSGGMVGWTGELQGASYWIEPANLIDTSASITVRVYVLNVRNAPSTRADILTRIRFEEVYSVVGRLADNSWVQVNVNGTIGWVNATYVNAVNLNTAPVIAQ